MSINKAVIYVINPFSNYCEEPTTLILNIENKTKTFKFLNTAFSVLSREPTVHFHLSQSKIR